MPIRVKCDKCKKTLSVKDHLAGKKIKCPLCQGVVAVPLASPTKEPPATAKQGVDPAKKPAPKATSETSVKKATTAKTVAKPAPGKPETNGAPSSNGEKTNGKAPTPVEEPPANLEEEALAALADEAPPAPEEGQTPKTIDFKCQWCDEDLKLPIELGGKQAQCPNPECKRIIKVPMPKVEEKKDWRKMDRKGPAAALINQPEALENAWGTEEASKARSDSLAQAGIGVPEKPRRGVLGWLKVGAAVVGVLTILAALITFGLRTISTKREDLSLKEIEKWTADSGKVTDPILRGEVHRTLVLYHLRGLQPKPGVVAKDFSAGSNRVTTDGTTDEAPHLNEQFFLIDLALARSEVKPADGNDELTIEKKDKEWDQAQKDIKSALEKIPARELQLIALRRLGHALRDKRPLVAIALAGSLGDPAAKKRHPAFRQQIAFVFHKNMLDKMPDIKEPNLADLKELDASRSDLRVGFAEGHALKDNYEQAFKIANFPGPEFDRLDANLEIAATALLDKKNDKAAEAFKTALELAKNPNTLPSPTIWHWFELARIGIRLEDPAAPEIVKALPAPFKARAQLEIVLAQCDKSTSPQDTSILAELEAAKEKDRTSLALGWTALARQHARTGGSHSRLEKTLEQSSLSPDEKVLIRPMIEIGWYQGLLK
ncbi:MAG TPA: hypothetical protein VFE62_11930 [Gemmataceae bacterium]|nr:hypothetical protein [Gemmataceae bacterium]